MRYDMIDNNNKLFLMIRRMGISRCTMPKTLLLLATIFLGCEYTGADSTVYSAPYEYIFVTTTKTWSEAKADCEARIGVLVKIGSADVSQIITDNYPPGRNQMWVGLTDSGTEGQWKWVADGQNVSYTNWVDDQPDNFNNEDCGTVGGVKRDKKWNDVDCGSRYGYICQKHKVYVGQNVLLFSYDRKKWEQANAECEKHGMHLVKIDSDALTTSVSENYGLETGGRAWKWIGADDIDSEGDWKWLDGTPASRSSAPYHKWNDAVTEPNGGKNENCATADVNGGWIDAKCQDPREYICQQDEVYFTDQYRLYFSSGKVTRGQAKTDCEKSNSHLIKIDSDSLTNVIKNNSKENRWIGASEKNHVGDWRWLDGTKATKGSTAYTKWAGSEPNGAEHGEHCAVARSDGLWNDVSCTKTWKSICQKLLPTTVSHNGREFVFHRTERVSWDEAKRLCGSKGSRLAEIYDEGTNNVIKSNIINPSAEFFCGGKLDGSTVSWDSGRSASYISGWAEGEADDVQHNRIALSSVGWKDMQSSNSLPYICEMVNLTNVQLSVMQISIGKGDVVQTVCSADGVPFSNVYWKFSSTVVTDDSSGTVYQTKSDGRSVLHVANAVFTDEGNFTCFAENQAGNFSKTLHEEFQLKVPSTPEFVTIEPEACSPRITVRWKPNSRARNVTHQIIIRNEKNESERYEFGKPPKASPDETFTVDVKEWMFYKVKVKLCPNGVCKNTYAKSNHTSSPTVGRPGNASSLKAEVSNKYSCSIKWQPPNDSTESEYISNYTVIIKKRRNYPEELTAAENTTTVDKNHTTYVTEEKANIRYDFGIQAETCAGVGEIVWSEESCVTDTKAPEEVTKPGTSASPIADGKVEVTIDVPSQENGRISCIFVVVKVHETSDNASANEYRRISNYTRDDLIKANETTNKDEYIALALRLQNLSGNIKVILGDGNTTQCDISPTAKRRKRSVNNDVFVGRNLKLDASKNNSVFIVTSSPANDGPIFKASESVRVVAVTGSGPGGQGVTAIIGGSVSGVIVLLAIVILVILVFKKRKIKPQKHTDPPVTSPYENCGANAGNGNGVSTESQYADIGEHPYEMSPDVIYQNNEATIPTKKRTQTDIPMQDFEKTYNNMHDNQGAAFIEQFQEITQRAKNQELTTEFASKPELKSRNRYKNILPFDNTRVPILHSDDGYINACFIDGFEQKKKYIATQGPLSKTVNDFWLMIVEQKVTSIVMLAKCIEAGKKKCEKYWPDIGGTKTFGLVTVSNANEVRSCGFVCRTLNVKAKLESVYETTVSQYHFLTWPDHGFPLTTSHILRMHQRVVNSRKNTGSTSPIVVHCSAGAGRTGTFIGYDYLLNESKSVGNADVFECVAKMRSQRVEMVQNCDQFILVHKLLLETHLYPGTDISRQEVLEKFSDSNYKKKAIATEFGNLGRVKPMDMTQKNTHQKICAYDRMRLKLYEDGSEIAKYLSASYVEAYDDNLKIIVSKQPASSKVELFWRLFCNLNITTIVMITENEHDSLEYWNRGPESGEFTIEMDSEQTTPNFTVRKLTIKGLDTKSVTHLHLKLDSSHATRKTVSKINACVDRLQKELRELHGAALIHCKSGTGMSGVFCAMMNILERLAVEDRVDVFRAVKDLRDCKKGIIETQAQYALCYDGILEYLRNFDTYSNFM